MVKYFSRKNLVTVLAVLGLTIMSPAFAAYNTVQFTADSSVNVPTPNVTYTISSGSKVSDFIVEPAFITVVLERDGSGVSSITFTSASKYVIDNNGGVNTTCGSNSSTLTLNGPETVSTKTIRITPSTTVCSDTGTAIVSGGSGGGGGSSTPSPAPTPTPAPSSGTATLEAQIVVLRAQIASLLQQLAAKQGLSGGQNLGTIVSSFRTSLNPGLKNNSDVKRLQEFLIGKGYLRSGLTTGNYLTLTVEAVKKYQKAKGIQAIGVVGPQTRAAINTELGQ